MYKYLLNYILTIKNLIGLFKFYLPFNSLAKHFTFLEVTSSIIIRVIILTSLRNCSSRTLQNNAVKQCFEVKHNKQQ